MQRLKKRAEFLAVSRGARAGRRAFSLQCGAGASTLADEARVGFTVTKKVGTATERNRIRRRLREAIRALPEDAATPGRDYVVVGRREALGEPFAALVADLKSALRQLRRQGGRPSGQAPGASRTGPAAGSDTPSAERPNPSGDT
jgi:ribonuclease P protein component